MEPLDNSWEVQPIDRYAHVMPRADMRAHEINDCWCSPIKDENGYIIHNSLDEREKFEIGERKPS